MSSFRGAPCKKPSKTAKVMQSLMVLPKLLLNFVSKTFQKQLQMFFKVHVLKNFANFTGKQLCWSLRMPATSLKRDCNTGVFL